MKNNNSQLKVSEKGAITDSVKSFTEKFVSDTYSSDIKLFEKLGLKPFSKITPHKEYYVGEVKLDYGSTVKISVYPMPAMFWTFDIYIAETRKTVIVHTGSGTLSKYWETINLIADNLIDFKSKD